jgi:exodeoxyribonuclease VII large subunit
VPRHTKSQWEFEGLFPQERARRVYTVSELTAEVKRCLERELGQVWVTGELSNLRLQSSGHRYFTLKDATAQLSCVLFRGETIPAKDLLEDGLRVLVQGDLTVYEPRGQYQLVVRQIEFQGVGALQLAFERLKRKLQGEGLFAAERKRSLPRFPQRLGLVTSPTGAAIRDVLHVIRRRQPGLRIILAPCRVQGEGAAAEIVAAVQLLNDWHRQALARDGLDLILMTRGGGSLEDLWAFNEESVARAIAGSALPVVSAVGHEIDFTISDFVADLRAATPSAAAELITEGAFASREWVGAVPERLGQAVRRRLESAGEHLAQCLQRLRYRHPRRHVNEQLQHLDDLLVGLSRSTRFRWRDHRAAWRQLHTRLLAVRPGRVLEQRRRHTRELMRGLSEKMLAGVRNRGNRLVAAEARLRLLSPLNVLERGYSITREAVTGRVIRSATEVAAGQAVRTQLRRGQIVSVVQGREPERASGEKLRGDP